jgi:hypothetical protein
VQNGKKVSAKLQFEAARRNGAAPAAEPSKEDMPFEVLNDGLRQLMERSFA